ncbi:MAG: glycosyltransferase [Alteraurantiacibacter sp.]
MTRPVICLAASGGGHLRQLLELRAFWSAYPHFFVSEDTSLARSVAESEEVHLVPHFALGQARLGRPLHMFANAWKAAWKSLSVIREKRPDFVLTTGAGSQFFVLLWARLFGARIVLLDSFARFERPSKFALLAGPLAHHRIAQSRVSARHWRGAEWFDPLVETLENLPEKRDLILATVGATLPFARLTDAVIGAKSAGDIAEPLVVQTGAEEGHKGSETGLIVIESLPYDAMQAHLAEAGIVICHGGTGSILSALAHGCKVLVVPREFSRGEHYDDHQREITDAFVACGLVATPRDGESLSDALVRMRALQPRIVRTDYGPLVERLDAIIEPSTLHPPYR